MTETLKRRHEVKEEETWDLSALFPSDEAYEKALAELNESVATFTTAWQGKIVDTETVIDALTQYEQLLVALVPLGSYASLSESVDGTNTEHQMRSNRFASFQATFQSAVSFVESELLALDAEVLNEAAQSEQRFANYLQKLMRWKPHQLHPEVEKALSAFSSTFSGPYTLYNTTKLTDITFPTFEVDGTTYPMSYNIFEGKWDTHPNTAIRREAFRTFHETLRRYENTTAKTYDLHIQREKTEATLRGFDSVIDYLLFDQDVSREMYDRQIDIIMEQLAPHMRKYAKLIQETYGLEKMTFSDLKAPLDPSYVPEVTVEEAKRYVLDALAVMGDDYKEMLETSFNERWIDFAQNIGKSTGAFCASPYGYQSYVLMSWTGGMEDVFTLAHELGHAGHFQNAHEHQNYFNARTSMYFVEAPSTMNEMLLMNHLLQTSEDLRFKRWVIASIVSNTYYHNFVTHLLEAAYQRKVYERIDAGGSVNASILNEMKRDVLQTFWGDAVEIEEGAELTWMRQPHYYMGLYPYTYSAGLTISTTVSQRILNEGKQAVEDWLNVLRAGGSKRPDELAQMAGVNITTDKPLRETVQYIGSLVEELETLTAQLRTK